jgi:DNA-binding SARP family transcriptional activator
MGILQVALLGTLRISHDDWVTEVQFTGENQALLAYLVLQRHRIHSREVLADMFWGENNQERARGSFNTALWKLKKALEPKEIPAGTYLKTNHTGGVGFNPQSPYWLDTEVFENEINRILLCHFQDVEETGVLDLQKALGLYKGDLVEGVYKDWAFQERERLRAMYLESLIYLLQYYAFHGAYEKAIAYGQQILYLDPLREEIHREIMRLHLVNGQRALAIRQYEKCYAMLATELGIAPMEDTQAMYKQILADCARSYSPVISEEQINFNLAMRRLRKADRAIDLAKRQIKQALKMLAQDSKRKK